MRTLPVKAWVRCKHVLPQNYSMCASSLLRVSLYPHDMTCYRAQKQMCCVFVFWLLHRDDDQESEGSFVLQQLPRSCVCARVYVCVFEYEFATVATLCVMRVHQLVA